MEVTASKSNETADKCEQDESDTNFVWQDYLEVTSSEEVPHSLFKHVEESLSNELVNGMLLEVPHKDDPNKYWLAKVALACGQFSRLRYLGDKDDQSGDFWCDLTKINAHSLGWCAKEGKDLIPPPHLAEKIPDSKALVAGALFTAISVPSHLLSGEGFVPGDRIKLGMKVEVQDVVNPYHVWIASVIENVGGRLLLRYETPNSSSPDFWLYFTSPRIFPFGWASQKGLPWELRCPESLLSSHGREEWDAFMEMIKVDAQQLPLPRDLFLRGQEPPKHSFTLSMKLEALHPVNRSDILPATVVKVYDETYFLLELDGNMESSTENENITWLCTADHPYIFPVGWARKHGLEVKKPIGWRDDSDESFHWDEYLKEKSALAAPDSCFIFKPCAKQVGFLSKMKLEAVNPKNCGDICVATVMNTTGHIIWLHLECNESNHPHHATSVNSLEIFPVGWCDSNSYPLKPPLYYQVPSSDSNNGRGGSSEGSQERKQDSSEHHTNSSQWCPKIYFNPRCFSGPFLSKCKLAGLPKSVGPGPVRLVMREVLSMIISVAYKSSRVLRELQSDGRLRPGEALEVLKAKCNQTNYRARVAVVTSANQVVEFCKEICAKLKVCPCLFGPLHVETGKCPEQCHTQAKAKFSHYWSAKRNKTQKESDSPPCKLEIVGPRKKRGRKKRFSIVKTRSSLFAQGGESDGSGDSGRLDSALGDSEMIDLGPRRREIVTRGARLAHVANTEEQENTPKLTSGKRGVKRPLQKERENSSSFESTVSPHKSWLDPLPDLESNPLCWSVDDVARYLDKAMDCKPVSRLLRREQFDGRAFLLLNLPTVQNQLKLKPPAALKLCRLVAQVKVVFFQKYAHQIIN